MYLYNFLHVYQKNSNIIIRTVLPNTLTLVGITLQSIMLVQAYSCLVHAEIKGYLGWPNFTCAGE